MKFRLNAMETAGALMVLSLVLVAILAPWLAPYDPTRAVANTFGDPGSPSRLFPLGTDQLGRDVLSRIIFGARISLIVGVAAMAVTMTIGVTVGLASGFFGGAIDFILMRATDVMLTLPALLLAMAFVAVLRPSIWSILLVIGLVSWTQIARVVRAEALTMTQRDFVMAARALGAPSSRLIGPPRDAERDADNRRDGRARHLRHPPARRGPFLPHPRRAAAHAQLGPHDRRSHQLLPHCAVARDFSRPRDLLRRARLQSPRLRLPAPSPQFRKHIPMMRAHLPDRHLPNRNDGATIRRNLIAFAIVAVALSGCRASAPPLHFPPNAMVLKLASISDVPTLDPAAGYDVESWMFEQMIFDTLVRYSDAGVDLVPDLATSWQASPDATTFTFHLRRDAHFTNGRSVTSADFKYAIERVLDPATRSKGIEYYRAIAGAADFIAHRATTVAGIETPDPWTIVILLAEPDPIFLHKLAMPFASAVPRESVEQWGEDFSRHVVGSGPFILKEWVGGQRIVMAKNPDYFVKGFPRLDAVVESIGVSEDLQWFKFEGGEIDVSNIPPAVFPYVMKTPRLRKLTLRIVTVTTRYFGMNCQMPPFNDERVRRAFNYAVNKPKLIAVLNGRGIVANGVMPPGLPGFNPHLNGYPYDPARAPVARAGRPRARLRGDALDARRSDDDDPGAVGAAGPRPRRRPPEAEGDRLPALPRSDSPTENGPALFRRLGGRFSRSRELPRRPALAQTMGRQQRRLLQRSARRCAPCPGRAAERSSPPLRHL
jgi:hypothetical protein